MILSSHFPQIFFLHVCDHTVHMQGHGLLELRGLRRRAAANRGLRFDFCLTYVHFCASPN